MEESTLLQLQGEYRILLMQAGFSEERASNVAGILIDKLINKVGVEDE